MIKASSEWDSGEGYRLYSILRSLNLPKDKWQQGVMLIQNIERMINDLSKHEVIMRQRKLSYSSRDFVQRLTAINSAIEEFEEIVVIEKLST